MSNAHPLRIALESALVARPDDLSDKKGVRDLLDSGMLKRLRFLDLDNGRITDEGARLPAAGGQHSAEAIAEELCHLWEGDIE